MGWSKATLPNKKEVKTMIKLIFMVTIVVLLMGCTDAPLITINIDKSNVKLNQDVKDSK